MIWEKAPNQHISSTKFMNQIDPSLQSPGRNRRNCLFPGCSRVAGARGLCVAHYQSARYLVIQGLVTWEQLVAQGKATSSKRRGGNRHRVSQWFLQAAAATPAAALPPNE